MTRLRRRTGQSRLDSPTRGFFFRSDRFAVKIVGRVA